MTLIRLDRTDGAAVLTLDRPPVNAMNLALLGDLAAVAAEVAADPPPRGLVVTGANGVFSAGADIKEAPGYDADHAMVPHGTSVIVHTPAVCRFTAPSAPERHLQAAAALGADISGASPDEAGEVLAGRVLHFMREMEQPMGISEFGYTEADVPRLVDGTLVQARLLKLSPIETGPEELADLFRNSLNL